MARILIVDDDLVVSETFTRILRLEGYDVSAAHTAEAGLDRVVRDRPDGIILDMRMPLMGGLDFLRTLRATPPVADLPVAVVTGDYFLAEDVFAELRSLGANIWFKPVWIAELSALARALFDPDAPQSSPAPTSH